MIKSMTACAQAAFTDDPLQITIEIRTYNHRFLDINLRLANLFSSLGDRIKETISSRIARGRVEVTIQHSYPERYREGNLSVNWPLARTYLKLLNELKESLHLAGSVDLGMLLTFKDIITYQEPPIAEEVLWRKLSGPLKKVLEGVEKMRLAEGRNLTRDLQLRIKEIQKDAETISQRVPLGIDAYRSKLIGKINQMLGSVEVDPIRIAQEVAILADRSDISEELVRLESHLKQLKALFKESSPTGRKMDFLLQEINREVNTIGSKSTDSAVSHRVVAIKSELERIREQVQNIE